MKNKILLSILLLSTSLTGFCTIWTVTNTANTFTPATITITVGDTVNFVITTAHNAIEVSQATYNANGNTALSGGFQTAFGGGMVLPAQLGVGTHYYVCTPHASMGMKGTIIVQNCSAPATPTAINGNATVCSTSSNTYSVTSVSGATSYTWTLPSGWTGTSTTDSITATASTTSGNITVAANNACGSSVAQTLAINVNTTVPTAPGIISGNSTVCEASLNTYSVAQVSGATSYTWTLPSGWTGASTTTSITTAASTTSGDIAVSANNSCGLSAPQSLNVSVNLVDTSVSQSGTILTANISGAAYQWINCSDNAIISGQINQSYNATANGNYAVIITQNGCSDTSSCYSISTVGIAENSFSIYTFIYPNPSNGKFQITVDGLPFIKNGNIEIYNVQGKIVYQSVITNTKSDIDLSNQTIGIYFVKIYNGQTVLTKKIALQ